MTKETIEQYERVRQSGLTNMFDYRRVVAIAEEMDFVSLASVTKEEYIDILKNYSTYVEKFKILRDSQKED